MSMDQKDECSTGMRDFPCRWKISGLVYGPRAMDWKVYTSPYGSEYDMAAEFWYWIENPEIYQMPGSFVEHYEDVTPLGWELNLDQLMDQLMDEDVAPFEWKANLSQWMTFDEFQERKTAQRIVWEKADYPQPSLSRREKRLRKWEWVS